MNKWAARAVLFAVTAIAIILALYLNVVVGMDRRWVSVLGLSALVFGLVVSGTKGKWNYGRYWLILIACLIVHLALLYAVRVYLGQFPLAILGLFGTLEVGGIVWLLLTVCE